MRRRTLLPIVRRLEQGSAISQIQIRARHLQGGGGRDDPHGKPVGRYEGETPGFDRPDTDIDGQSIRRLHGVQG